MEGSTLIGTSVFMGKEEAVCVCKESQGLVSRLMEIIFTA